MGGVAGGSGNEGTGGAQQPGCLLQPPRRSRAASLRPSAPHPAATPPPQHAINAFRAVAELPEGYVYNMSENPDFRFLIANVSRRLQVLVAPGMAGASLSSSNRLFHSNSRHGMTELCPACSSARRNLPCLALCRCRS